LLYETINTPTMKLNASLLAATLALASSKMTSALRGRPGRPTDPQDQDEEDKEETLIVTFKGDDRGSAPARCDALASAQGGAKTADFDRVLNACAMKVSRRKIKALERDESVLSVERDQVMTASQEVKSWGLDRINQCAMPLDNSAVQVDAGGAKVYILDTGVQGNHADLAPRIGDNCHFVAPGMPSDEPGALIDLQGHGTHVASTACGVEYGVATNCDVCAVKVLSGDGFGSTSGVIAGINFAAQNCDGNCVANLSLGGPASSALNLAVENAVEAGVTVIVAAGNSNSNACNGSPSGADDAITVGSTDKSFENGVQVDIPSSFSSWGDCVNVYAPGSAIRAAVPGGGAGLKWGTSMASPRE
jgi:serine protease